MTVRKCFKFGKMPRSDVKIMFLIFVLLAVLDNLPVGCLGEHNERGIIQFTNSISARQRWALSHDIRSTIISCVYKKINLQNEQDVTAELSNHNMKNNSKQLQQFTDTFNQFINPFSAEIPQDILLNISSGKAASEKVEKFLLDIEKNGDKRRQTFIAECKKKENRFEKSIKKVPIENFSVDYINKKRKTKVGGKVQEVRIQRDLFGRMLGISIDHQVDMSKILSYPITTMPLSMCHFEGGICKTQKSVLMKSLEKGVEHDPPSRIDVLIIDGFFLLHTMKNVPKTFGSISKKMLQMVTQLKATRYDVIFDQYFSPSIKDYERSRRHESSQLEFNITGPDQVRPADFAKELKNIHFKQSLVEFFILHWATDEMIPLIGNNIFFINFRQCHSFIVINNKVISEIHEDLSCSEHEEADTKIVYHVCNIDTRANFVIRCSDTDITAIMLGNMHHLKNSDSHVWILTGTGNKRRYVDLSTIYKQLGSSLCRSLPAFHAITGCDFNPAFFKKGKQRPFNILKKNEEYQQAFHRFGFLDFVGDADEEERVFNIIQKFICDVYNVPGIIDVDAARLQLFINNYMVSDINEEFNRKKIKNFDASSLPPCKSELWQQFRRANYIATLWNNATVKIINISKPENNGWTLIDDKYDFHWFDGDQLPGFVSESLEEQSDSRKLFGGYRITPTYCKASRAAKFNRGNTICMFNHECVQRGGEVVGACMDGFLFGACCQLKSDSQSHIPKGPGIVMTSYLDYPDATEADDYEVEELSAWHNSYKPVVTPGYKPDKFLTTSRPEETLSTDDISEGLTQITNSLLNAPPKDTGVLYLKPKPDGYYTHSSIDHGGPDTILFHTNGSIDNTVVRPSDFNIQLSSMQTKPTVAPSTTLSTSPRTVSTHRPVKPIFKPKPATTTEHYVVISTVTKDSQRVPELSSINSIIQMLNDSTPSMKEDVTPSYDVMETKSSPAPAYTYPTYSSTGHYVTLKPTSLSTYLTKKPSTYLTSKPSTYVTSKPSTYSTSRKPSYDYIHTTPNSLPQDDKPSSYYSSPSPSQSTSQAAIDAFNRYPTDPTDFGDLSTFSYVSSTTTQKPRPKPTPPKRPPSTSYVTGSSPIRRPDIPPNSPVYSTVDTFSSVTPTVIVLNDIHTTKPPPEDDEPQFVEISQEPFKKPVSQITVNNHITSTNNIYMKPSPYKPQASSPTVVITPKPGVTTPYPIKSSSTRPLPIYTSQRPVSSQYFDITDAPTTNKPEMQTSPDDSINFPPVRNPMLNATGSNSALYNTSISLSDYEIEALPDIEFTTPTWETDDKLNDKMNIFVNKIVGNLQGTFQELHDIVILGAKPNKTATTTQKPKRTYATTKRPFLTTTKKPARITTTTRKPTVKTTKKPVRLTTPSRLTTPPRRTTTTAVPTTTSTKKPLTTTKKPKPTKKPTTTTQAATSTTTEYVDEVTTENYVDGTIDYNDKNLCGVRPLSKSGRIVGGKNARFGSWPWQVLVRESTWLGLFTKNKCGGVLITNRFVTTAAHCQPGFLASLVAVFGENDISGDNEPRKPVSRNVRKVIVHRQYDAATFENDLALLELESPIKFDAHIVPICMPPDESDFTGRMASVTGWGRLKYGGGVPAVLQEVQVPVIENSACQDMFQTAGHSKKILNSFICAGYANGQKDSCEGDSGGPLVLQRDDGRWQLVGTVSHGIKCAAPFLPGVYMRTTFYKPWLKSIAGVH